MHLYISTRAYCIDRSFWLQHLFLSRVLLLLLALCIELSLAIFWYDACKAERQRRVITHIYSEYIRVGFFLLSSDRAAYLPSRPTGGT